jgi:hypothetical protein
MKLFSGDILKKIKPFYERKEAILVCGQIFFVKYEVMK